MFLHFLHRGLVDQGTLENAGLESATDEREVSVIVDPDRLSGAKLTLDQVSEALKNTNKITSVGRLPKDYQQYLAKRPVDAIVHYDLGYVYSALNRPADAKS